MINFTGSEKPSCCRSAIFARILWDPKPKIVGFAVIILTGSLKPNSRRSAILLRTLSIRQPEDCRIGGDQAHGISEAKLAEAANLSADIVDA